MAHRAWATATPLKCCAVKSAARHGVRLSGSRALTAPSYREYINVISEYNRITSDGMSSCRQAAYRARHGVNSVATKFCGVMRLENTLLAEIGRLSGHRRMKAAGGRPAKAFCSITDAQRSRQYLQPVFISWYAEAADAASCVSVTKTRAITGRRHSNKMKSGQITVAPNHP